MKQQIKTTEAILPMPVLLISTFNEDGSVDVMNAAWGTMLDRDRLLCRLLLYGAAWSGPTSPDHHEL
jgi:hypothetical protein